MQSTVDCAWLPLGSALVIDWKHLGRNPATRGAAAWVRELDGESVLLRSWGVEATSYFEFVFVTDERLAGTLVISVARDDPGQLRIKVSIEIEGLLGLAETTELREHPRTLALGRPVRNVQVKLGGFPPEALPALSARDAETLETAPDGVLLTRTGDWVASVLRAVRDHVRQLEAPAHPEVRVHNDRAATRSAPTRQTIQGPVVAEPSSPATDDVLPPRQTERVPDRLICQTNAGENFEITGAETYIGRSKQCTIVLKSQRVSRKHACVTRETDGFYINDVGAANGIWAGSEKIQRERIKTGDQFIIGDVVLSFSFA